MIYFILLVFQGRKEEEDVSMTTETSHWFVVCLERRETRAEQQRQSRAPVSPENPAADHLMNPAINRQKILAKLRLPSELLPASVWLLLLVDQNLPTTEADARRRM